MAWIHTVDDVAQATGRLRRIYEAALKRAGKIFGIVRLMSIEPASLEACMGLYQATTMDPRSPLPRWFRELVAVHVSRLNGCEY